MAEPRLYLICGLPGAGKTTRAKEIALATHAVRLCPDEWLTAVGISLVNYEPRWPLERHLLAHGEDLLRAGASVIVEFGSWSRSERDGIRELAMRVGVPAELHFVDAPLDELVRRVRARGGADMTFLADEVLLKYSVKFERPTNEETALYERYVGPG